MISPFGGALGRMVPLALLPVLVLLAGRAEAVSFIGCVGGLPGGVTPHLACTGITGTSNDSAAVMNTAPGAFGLTDWVLIGRDNAQPEAGDIDIFATGDFVTGTFSFAPSLVAGFQSVALVLKSATHAEPCGIAAYLLPAGVTSGSFDSPFLCPAGEQQELSHLSIYASQSTAVVPLPPAAALLLSALALTGLALRRGKAGA